MGIVLMAGNLAELKSSSFEVISRRGSVVSLRSDAKCDLVTSQKAATQKFERISASDMSVILDGI